MACQADRVKVCGVLKGAIVKVFFIVSYLLYKSFDPSAAGDTVQFLRGEESRQDGQDAVCATPTTTAANVAMVPGRMA